MGKINVPDQQKNANITTDVNSVGAGITATLTVNREIKNREALMNN